MNFGLGQKSLGLEYEEGDILLKFNQVWYMYVKHEGPDEQRMCARPQAGRESSRLLHKVLVVLTFLLHKRWREGREVIYQILRRNLRGLEGIKEKTLERT